MEHLLVEFHLSPSHKLRTTLATKAEEVVHRREKAVTSQRTELSAEPPPVMVIQGRGTDTLNIPSHIEEEFKVVARNLYVVHIRNPEFAHMVVVGFAHLVIDQTWLCGSQPEIVVRTPPVAEMIIDTTPTLSLLFTSIGETRHVAIVIIAPHQGDIVWHLQSHLIELQHLLIRYEHLRQP